MDHKTFWIWDIDGDKCINARAIEYFDIEDHGEKGYVLFANMKGGSKAFMIDRKKEKGQLKAKIRSLLIYLGG